jgi:ribosomal protein L40E
MANISDGDTCDRCGSRVPHDAEFCVACADALTPPGKRRRVGVFVGCGEETCTNCYETKEHR